MKFTDEDKKKIHDLFIAPFGFLACTIDGVDCAFKVERTGALSYCVMPFVNGTFKGIWLMSDNVDFGHRLLRKVNKPVWRGKSRDKMKKLDKLKKKDNPEHVNEYDKVFVSYEFWYDSKSLIKHLEDNFENVVIN